MFISISALGCCERHAKLDSLHPALNLVMALSTRKVTSRHLVSDMTTTTNLRRPVYLFSKSKQQFGIHNTNQGVELNQQRNSHLLTAKFSFSNKSLWPICRNPENYIVSRGSSVLCWSNGTRNIEAKESARDHNVPSELSG